MSSSSSSKVTQDEKRPEEMGVSDWVPGSLVLEVQLTESISIPSSSWNTDELGDWGRDDDSLCRSSAFREGRSQDDAPMLTELFPDCVVQTEPGSDWVQLLSEGGTALQKLAVEQTLCLEVPFTCGLGEGQGFSSNKTHAFC